MSKEKIAELKTSIKAAREISRKAKAALGYAQKDSARASKALEKLEAQLEKLCPKKTDA